MKKWIKALLALAFVVALGGWGTMEAMKRAWIRLNEYDIRTEGSEGSQREATSAACPEFPVS